MKKLIEIRAISHYDLTIFINPDYILEVYPTSDIYWVQLTTKGYEICKDSYDRIMEYFNT